MVLYDIRQKNTLFGEGTFIVLDIVNNFPHCNLVLHEKKKKDVKLTAPERAAVQFVNKGHQYFQVCSYLWFMKCLSQEQPPREDLPDYST